jgi:nucleoid-associated protein YgaU
VIVEVDQSGRFFPPGATEAPEGGDQSGIVVPPHLEPESTPAGHEPDPDQRPSAEPSVDGSVSHPVTVRHGDHLWGLSERHLTQVIGRSDLGEHEIARYWVRVIEANRDTIRSGNPDLIYPGEILVLPAVTPVP